ncbi:MAG TPA: hypothetical protein VHA10_12210 [Hypericibacter adhaerens]|uniref:hypothetical protein n=1 Tax=Hypericibacter adhaerens TaxID=2602016 RepID=UPI002B7D73A3|nr:hypothetical protein [Hypericibacter adhaerens]HWA43968.1 hypothetical protein [Hypericibacter adhaerens]
MLFRPPRRPNLLHRLLASLRAGRAAHASEAADARYLDRLSDGRLERDLGLVRSPDRRYRPY